MIGGTTGWSGAVSTRLRILSRARSADCGEEGSDIATSVAVGIDLGTTFSLIAVAGEAGVRIIANADGERLTPSVVRAASGEPVVVGEQARRAAVVDPDSVMAFFKLDMGTAARYRLSGQEWTPVQLSAEVLRRLREDGERELGGSIDGAVVTIPAYFGDDARRATAEAAQLAGLDVLHLIHEPTAAAVAFGVHAGSRGRRAVVYDLGGGTFDVSVVQFMPDGIDVLATAGDHHLGGKNWDEVIMRLVAEEFERRHGVDPRDDTIALADLRERAEQAKRALSRTEVTSLTLVCGGVADRIEVSRDQFEANAAPLLGRTELLLGQVLADIRAMGTAIDATLLVGGSTRMPACRRVLQSVTGLEPLSGVDPDEAVARGAALMARTLTTGGARTSVPSGENHGSAIAAVRDVTAHALGFVVISLDGKRYVNQVMIARNARIPAVTTRRQRINTRPAGPNTLDVYLLQGEPERPLETTPLGRWTFTAIPHSRSGEVDVDVAFGYDSNGVVSISASVDGRALDQPTIDNADRDIAWTDEDPREHRQAAIDVCLAIDCSGSMSGRPLEEARDACRAFVKELAPRAAVRVALVSFASGARVEAELGAAAESLQSAIERLHIYGGTDMANGLSVARASLDTATSPSRKAIVLLTDGEPDDRPATVAAAKACKDQGIEVLARGVTGADANFLASIASADDGLMTTLDEMADSFRGIARQLSQTAARGEIRRS